MLKSSSMTKKRSPVLQPIRAANLLAIAALVGSLAACNSTQLQGTPNVSNEAMIAHSNENWPSGSATYVYPLVMIVGPPGAVSCGLAQPHRSGVPWTGNVDANRTVTVGLPSVYDRQNYQTTVRYQCRVITTEHPEGETVVRDVPNIEFPLDPEARARRLQHIAHLWRRIDHQPPSPSPASACLRRSAKPAARRRSATSRTNSASASDQKKELRQILRELEDSGALGRTGRKRYADAHALPESGVMDILDRDADGELLARMRGPDGYFGPSIRLAPGEARAMRAKRQSASAIACSRASAATTTANSSPYRQTPRPKRAPHLRRLSRNKDPRHEFGGGRVEPADRKARHDIIIEANNVGDAKDGDLVFAELRASERGRAHGPKRGIIKEVIGRESDPRAASILAMHTHGITEGFSADEEAQANAAQKPTLKGRTDLRDVPLITIDPEDARDHDDAVYASPDTDEKNKGGWRVWVAIADVSAYVQPGTALDRGAWRRGNSTYFPDRVAPMLPESLSADLCSLREHEERACLAVEMVFDREGRKLKHKFVRGLMRSAAKLSYEQAQAAIDGEPNDKTKPLLEPILKPLWAAYACVWAAARSASRLRSTRPNTRSSSRTAKSPA
jgi:hypothetical protein